MTSSDAAPGRVPTCCNCYVSGHCCVPDHPPCPVAAGRTTSSVGDSGPAEGVAPDFVADLRETAAPSAPASGRGHELLGLPQDMFGSWWWACSCGAEGEALTVALAATAWADHRG